MLTARKAPRACQSCRSHLLSLFEHGFAGSASNNASRLRYSTQSRLQPRPFYSHNSVSIRRFTVSSLRAEELKGGLRRDSESVEDAQINAESNEVLLGDVKPLVDLPTGAESLEDLRVQEVDPAVAIELVVRQARQTFGETLPKDYLSAEEYAIYERLYGPPLRATQPGDLEFLEDGEEDLDSSPIRNVILKENANGEFEEIEFDPGMSFSVTEEDIQHDLEDAEMVARASEENVDLTYIREEFESEPSFSTELASGDELLFEDVIRNEQEQSSDLATESREKFIFQGQNQREKDAMARLQQDMEEAAAQSEESAAKPEEWEDVEEEEEYFEEEEIIEEDEEDIYDGPTSDAVRTHPHTREARTGTNPSTIYLPRAQLTAPVTELLGRADPKHLMAAAEALFGGKGLPYSTSTPSKMKILPQKNIPLDAGQHKMSEIDADAYLAAVMPGTYSAVMSTLVEVRRRLGGQWIRDLMFREGGEGPRVLDVGAAGAGVVAWREMIQAEWDVLRDDGIVEGEEAPHGKASVITGSNTLRHRVSTFLDNTTFLPRLPDYVHSSRADKHIDGGTAQPRKFYDIIIAPHTLFPLKEEFRRKKIVENLWSLLDPNGGVLILIEKGLPRGFEAIAGARSLLLDSRISSPGSTFIETELVSSKKERFIEKEEGMIIAPCTNHNKCPMYPVPGLSTGRKDFCHFGQRFIRPNYLQKVLGASVRNHEDVKFSYLAVRRGVDARKGPTPILAGDEATNQSFEGYEVYDLPEGSEGGEQSDIKFHALSLPRAILPPLKRRGHVTLDLCTPSGQLERWTVPRSFSKIAYRDARKSKWGDLWALGAKTRTMRSPRLGRLGQEAVGKKLKGIRDGKMGKNGKKMKKTNYDVIMTEEGMEGIQQKKSRYMQKPEKRTKGGRIWKESKIITEADQ